MFVTEQVIPALEESAIVSGLAETEPHPDEDWADEMHKFRQDAEWFLVIVSEASTKSDWIRGEPAAIHPELAKLFSVHVDPADSVNCREELTKVVQRITGSSNEEKTEPAAPTTEV